MEGVVLIYPVVICDKKKLLENVNALSEIMHAQGRTFAAVTKCVCEAGPVFEVLENSNCDWIADSRIENLAASKTRKPKFLIRLAQAHEVHDVIAYADVSFQSEIETIQLLAAEAERQEKRHGVIVAIDMGDLREGCFFENTTEVEHTVRAVLEAPYLDYLGLGTNLGCFGGVKTDLNNMTQLAALAESISKKLGVEHKYISGANTGAEKMLFDGTLPKEVNHCRFGEAWLVGYDSVNHCAVPRMHQDVFLYEAQLIEIKYKPSKPIGIIGGDAFGRIVEREDKGIMRRGLIASGLLDINYEDLTPLDPRIAIVGGSSDHTILDLTKAPEYEVGDVVQFKMNYMAVMNAYTSKYVKKKYVE